MADYATLVFDIDSTQARGAAKTLADLNSAAIKAANGASRFEKTMRDSSGRFQSTSKYIAENRDEVERLALAYNPVLAAQIKYRDEAIRTGAAVKAGVITEQQRVDILQRTKAALDAATASTMKLDGAVNASSVAVKKFGDSQKVATHHATNLSFQLNDIGMMMASGQNPFMLMIQQGPQVAQIFGQMNAEGRKIGPTLAGAFRMFLNPTTLVTLALIGGTAALTQWGMSALGMGQKAKTASDAVDLMKSSLDSLKAANDAANISIEESKKLYGSWAEEARKNSIVALEAQKVMADLALNEAFATAFDPRNLQAMRAEIFSMQKDMGDFSAAAKQYAIEQSQANQQSLQMYGLTFAELERIEAISNELKRNDLGLNQKVALSRELNDIFLKSAQSGAEMSAESAKAADAISKQVDAALRLNKAVGDANRSMVAFRQTVATTSLGQLVAQAQSLAGGIWDAVDAAAALANSKPKTFLDRMGEAANNAWDMAQKRAKELEESPLGKRPGRRSFKLSEDIAYGPEGSGGGGGGGAGDDRAAAELKAAEKGFQSLRELLEKESLYQVAEYERRQAQLDNALSKKLISEQNYQLMRNQLQLTYFGSEYERNALQYSLDLQQLDEFHAQGLLKEEQYQMARKNLHSNAVTQLGQLQKDGFGQDIANMSKHFGEMAALAGSNNEKFLRAQKIFAAASALISTYQGAAKALELPFPYNIAAAGKVIAAGMGFISAIKGSGSGGSSGGGGSSSTATTVKEEPVRNVHVRLEGNEWLVGLADQLMTQVYEASANGRVIVSRDVN